MQVKERREITRSIAGFPLTDAECDVAELVAARVLEKTFSMDAQPRLCPHDGVVCRHDCEGDECWRELDGS